MFIGETIIPDAVRTTDGVVFFKDTIAPLTPFSPPSERCIDGANMYYSTEANSGNTDWPYVGTVAVTVSRQTQEKLEYLQSLAREILSKL